MTTTPALLTGLLSLVAGTVLWFVAPGWAWIPPAVFVFLCLVAPFLPAMGFFLEVVSRGSRQGSQVSLTFDDGPDPATTPLLLDLLDEADVRACFFVTGNAASRSPDLVQLITKRGHEIGNHSQTHDPIMMLRSTTRLAREVDDAQESLESLGVHTRIFRPPVGITNPRLGPILDRRGMTCVTYSLRAADAGNRRVKNLADKILARVRPGDVILLHDRTPAQPYSVENWLTEVRALLKGLDELGLNPVLLSELLGIETSERRHIGLT